MDEVVPDWHTPPTWPATVRELSDATCRELLSSHSVGRLAFVVEGYPVVLPVNYGFADDRIWIRTGHGEKLDHAPLSPVGFEIDQIDPATRTGWSVLARGIAHWATEKDLVGQSLVNPWVSDALPALLVVKVKLLSGRRIDRP